MAVTIVLRENGKFKSADRRDEYGCRPAQEKHDRRDDLCDANDATVLVFINIENVFSTGSPLGGGEADARGKK